MSHDRESMAELAAQTAAIYERQALTFERQRSRLLFEAAWLERFAALLPEKGKLLDLGCGAGIPFPAWFAARGFHVTGVDIAPAMLALARSRFPDGDWRQADMRALYLGETFDGIVAWHSFFHLTRAEQRRTLPRLAGHLKPAGALLMTVGPEDCETLGQVGGEPIYHASLAPAEYRAILSQIGLTLISLEIEDPACDRNTILLARKTG